MRVTVLRRCVGLRCGNSGLKPSRMPPGEGIMMSYTFDPSPIYSAGQVTSGWAVALLFFAVLALA